jgi:uncharacterized membrane protein (UPF0127 family)
MNAHAGTILIACVAATLLQPLSGRAAEPAELLRGFARDQAIVITATRCIRLSVYVAMDSRQRSQGLMFVRSMAEDEGMIFLYPEPKQISMWMKNTYIPLDMLFLDSELGITQIIARTEPLSETILEANDYVQGVLELNAGAAEMFGIAAGDRLLFPAEGAQEYRPVR